MQHFKYQNYFVFYWPNSAVFLINSRFSCSSLMPKRNSEVCVIFLTLNLFLSATPKGWKESIAFPDAETLR